MPALDATTSGKLNSNQQKPLLKSLEKTGRFPPVELIVIPLQDPKTPRNSPRYKEPFRLNDWLSYSYKSSILIPVDVFSFDLVAPDFEDSYYDLLNSGDIVQLVANNKVLATGIIDSVDVGTEGDQGERVTISGRDMMAQLEDNNVVSIDDSPIYANNYTIKQVVSKLAESTRINPVPTIQDAPTKGYLFATEPGESKLAALQRYLEPLNCLAWTSPEGRIVIGRPNMAQKRKGELFCIKSTKQSNVLSIKVMRETTRVPNIVVPIWSGQETVQARVPPSQRFNNPDPDADRLRKLGHRVIRTVVVSSPEATNPQGYSETNQLTVAGQNLLQAYAKREIARANIEARHVQAVVAGHYDDNGDPYTPDTVWKITYERGKVDEDMYLYEVDYKMDENEGQKTILSFCPLGSIVSDIKAP